MDWSLIYLLQSAPSGSPGVGGFVTFLPLVLIFVVIYLFIIRPQQKREKKRKAMIAAVRKGDKVVTAGGIHGKVHQVEDDATSILLDVDGGLKLRVEKQSIASVRE
ncbi:MAG: preprotein translocase subunit YajC [Bacteroidetes bacterium]|nr:preprotein translocase subunit YajC [Bacteroidota bacterium]MCY4233281.1 preprotein translocase subunit YajC [Bacteroidota bacterium]